MFITVSNPVVEDIDIKHNIPETTKDDRVHHGYGLLSLNKIVKKYDGAVNLSCEDRVFTVAIDLSFPQT